MPPNNLCHGLPMSASGAFDAVYGYLSLHYFTPDQTRRLIAEIWEALRPGGVFAFAVKSVNDPLCWAGEQVGENMFRFKGKVRHFFSPAYVYDLLTGWDVLHCAEQTVQYQSSTDSAVLHVLARKPATSSEIHPLPPKHPTIRGQR